MAVCTGKPGPCSASRFQQALQKVFTCRGRLCHLWQISSWRHAVHPWLARGQQDAAEFLQSISRKLINHALHTEWEARPQPPEYGLPSEVIDAGNVLPLPLSAQLAPGDGASPVTLQCLVNQWTHQAQRGQEVYFAAAEGPPPVLLLQVARFNSTGHKLSGSIVNSPSFQGHIPPLHRS